MPNAQNSLDRLNAALATFRDANPKLAEQLAMEVELKADGSMIARFPNLTAGDVTNFGVTISADGELDLGRRKWADGHVKSGVNSVEDTIESLGRIAESYHATWEDKKNPVPSSVRPQEMRYASGKAYPVGNNKAVLGG